MNRIQLRLGQAVGLKELIATLVVSGVLLIVGTVVFAKVKSSMEGSYDDGDGNATTTNIATDTVNNVESTAYDAFQLATVALIVLAAAVIIGILILFKHALAWF